MTVLINTELRSMWPIVLPAVSWEIFYIVSWVSVTSQLNKTFAVCLVLFYASVYITHLNFHAGITVYEQNACAYRHTHSRLLTNYNSSLNQRFDIWHWIMQTLSVSSFQVYNSVTVKHTLIWSFHNFLWCNFMCPVWNKTVARGHVRSQWV